jgi:hypothetical protein
MDAKLPSLPNLKSQLQKGSFQASQKLLIYKESAGSRPPPVIRTILIPAKTRYEDAQGLSLNG